MTPSKKISELEPQNISLRERVRRHQRRKAWFTTPLLALGLIGLVLPLIPALIFLEIALRIESPFGRSSLSKIIRGKMSESRKI